MPTQSIETQVAVLDATTKQTSAIIEKMDATIEKLIHLGNDVNKILAVHESRLNNDESMLREIFQEIKDIHARFGNIVEQRRKENTESVAILEQHIKSVKDELSHIANEQSEQFDDLKSSLSSKMQHQDMVLAEHETDLKSFRKYKYLIIGGVIVMTAIANILPIAWPIVKAIVAIP